jgi:hypothetical protein
MWESGDPTSYTFMFTIINEKTTLLATSRIWWFQRGRRSAQPISFLGKHASPTERRGLPKVGMRPSMMHIRGVRREVRGRGKSMRCVLCRKGKGTHSIANGFCADSKRTHPSAKNPDNWIIAPNNNREKRNLSIELNLVNVVGVCPKKYKRQFPLRISSYAPPKGGKATRIQM